MCLLFGPLLGLLALPPLLLGRVLVLQLVPQILLPLDALLPLNLLVQLLLQLRLLLLPHLVRVGHARCRSRRRRGLDGSLAHREALRCLLQGFGSTAEGWCKRTIVLRIEAIMSFITSIAPT